MAKWSPKKIKVFPLTSHYQLGNMSISTKKTHRKKFELTKTIDMIVEMLKRDTSVYS